MVSVAHRNHILCRVATALIGVERTLDAVDAFAAEFVLDVFGERLLTLDEQKRDSLHALGALHLAKRSFESYFSQGKRNEEALLANGTAAAAAATAQPSSVLAHAASGALLLAHPMVALSLHFVDSFYTSAPNTPEVHFENIEECK